MSNNTQHFEELELVAEKAGELNDRVGKIESELGTQTKTLESAALVLDAAIKGLGALKSSVLENDIGALQLALNDKTAHLAREIARFETAVAEIDRRAEAGDEQLAASLRDTALGLRESFNAKNAELAEWSARVEREIAAHSVALAAIPPVIKGADAKPFNPRGEWQAGMIVNSLDVVSYNGSSYISNEDGNTEKPTRSAKYTTLAKRSGNGAGGATDFAGITGNITPAQIVPGQATFAVGDVLYAGTTGTLSKLGAGTSGQLLSTQGAGAAPIWVTATGGAGDVNGPASATDNAIVRFDGTGGKTVQNSAVTVADTTGAMTWSGDATLSGGSSGASLVLGSGSSPTVTLSGVGALTTNLYAANNHTLNLGAFTNGLRTFWNNGSGAIQISPYGGDWPITWANSAGTAQVRLVTSTGNLLIGTTTDMASTTGGLTVAATGSGATATAVNTGGLRSANFGLSTVSGGASYFGGDVVVSRTSSPAIFNLTNAAGQYRILRFASAGSLRWDLYANTTAESGANAGSDFWLTRYDDTGASAGNALEVTRASGRVNIPTTTSASSSTVGALTIGNGTAATNVAIGGGKIVAGDEIKSFDGTSFVSAVASNATAQVQVYKSTADATLRLTRAGVRDWDIKGGTSFTIVPDSGSSVFTLTSAGALSLPATATPSTGVGTGALQVAGGIYAGAASVFGSTVTSAGYVGTTGWTPPTQTAAIALGYIAGDSKNRIFIGDASGYGLKLSARVSSTTTDLISFSDTLAGGFQSHYTGAATFAGAVTIGNTVNVVSPTSPNRTITMVVNGVTLYIAAKTTND